MMEIPDGFDSYAIVILRRRDDAPALGEEEARALQERHQSHVMSMVQSGAAFAAGPLTEGSDSSFVGLAVFSLPLEEAHALANEDPAVRAGQLVAESAMWSMPAGLLDRAT
jgi:uncharacterized protein